MHWGPHSLVDDDWRLVVRLWRWHIDRVLLSGSTILLLWWLPLGRWWRSVRSRSLRSWFGLVRWLCRLRAGRVGWFWRLGLVSWLGWRLVRGFLGRCLVSLFGRLLVLRLRCWKWLIAGFRSWRLVHWLGSLSWGPCWRWRRRFVCRLLGWCWLISLLWRLWLVLHLLQHRWLLVDVDWRVAGVDDVRSRRLLLRGLVGRLRSRRRRSGPVVGLLWGRLVLRLRLVHWLWRCICWLWRGIGRLLWWRRVVSWLSGSWWLVSRLCRRWRFVGWLCRWWWLVGRLCRCRRLVGWFRSLSWRRPVHRLCSCGVHRLGRVHRNWTGRWGCRYIHRLAWLWLVLGGSRGWRSIAWFGGWRGVARFGCRGSIAGFWGRRGIAWLWS